MPLQGISQQLLNSLVPNALNTLAAGEQRDQRTQIGQQNIDLNQLKLASGENDAKGREASSLLTFETPEQLRANLVRRAQELTRNPEPGLEASDLIDMANRLGQPNGFSRIQAELKSDIKRVQSISKQLLKQRFIGRPNRVSEGNKNFLVGIVQEPDGTFREERVEVAGDFISTLGETAAAQTKRKIGERVDIQEGVAGVRLKTEPGIAAEIVKAEGAAEVETPLGKIELREAKRRRRQEVVDLKAKNLAIATDADAAIDNITSLLKGGLFKRIYGNIQGFFPSVGEAITAEKKRDQIVALLALENRQKLKGSGAISDTEVGQLERSGTILSSPRITDKAAEIELKRVEKIFRRAKARATSGKLLKVDDAIPEDLSEDELDQEEARISERRAELDEQIRQLQEGQ